MEYNQEIQDIENGLEYQADSATPEVEVDPVEPVKKKKKRKKGFLQNEKGQRFFNFAYSIGAAIVIWGALFKILHLPGGSTLLCIGMGTEIAMFIITAFDRPSKEYEWEQVFPELDEEQRRVMEEAGINPGEWIERIKASAGVTEGGGYYGGGGYFGPSPGHKTGDAEYHTPEEVAGSDHSRFAPSAGGTVVVAGGSKAPGLAAATGLDVSEEDTVTLRESIAKMAAAADQLSQMAELTSATRNYIESISGIADQMTQLQKTTTELNNVSSILLDSYKAITENSASISESSSGYVERMGDLNRNISGLNTIYEIQLKSISSQLESIDRVNRGLKDIRDMYEKSARQSSRYCEETERMTRYMTQLNSVYEKMVTAMTINMYNPMMGQPQAPRQDQEFNPYGSSQNSGSYNNQNNVYYNSQNNNGTQGQNNSAFPEQS